MVGHDAEYNPAQHELTADTHIDKLVRPGLYSAPISLAGDHLIALGHIVKHSGISRDAGDYVLEYGAGFGQIALTFARLGAVVDTVDIDRTFCEAIKAQAEWFGLPLTPHVGEFGSNPTGKKYKLIVFYEAFHHARNFMELVPTLRSVLAVDRKIMMAGEPIVNTPAGQYSAQLPYPWGIRLDAEVGAIVR
jgi:2-polyprenyl-3-methyl-5-hydroxy-6-metoxy-1,4-benzoquinol methylase